MKALKIVFTKKRTIFRFSATRHTLAEIHPEIVTSSLVPSYPPPRRHWFLILTFFSFSEPNQGSWWSHAVCFGNGLIIVIGSLKVIWASSFMDYFCSSMYVKSSKNAIEHKIWNVINTTNNLIHKIYGMGLDVASLINCYN